MKGPLEICVVCAVNDWCWVLINWFGRARQTLKFVDMHRSILHGAVNFQRIPKSF